MATPLEKIAELEANELKGYTWDKKEVEHPNGIGRPYQQAEGAGTPMTLVIACTEKNISVEPG